MFATASRRVFQNATASTACNSNLAALYSFRCMSSIPSTMKVRRNSCFELFAVCDVTVGLVIWDTDIYTFIHIMRSYLRQSAIKPLHSIVCESFQVEDMVVAMPFLYVIVPAFSLRCCSGRMVVYEINDGRTLTNGRYMKSRG